VSTDLTTWVHVNLAVATPDDLACSYMLVPSLQYSIVIETVSYARSPRMPTR